MDTNVERLRREIEELERQIAAHPFEGLFDKKRADQLYQKLKKKRRELERTEAAVVGIGPDAMDEPRPAILETPKADLPVVSAIPVEETSARPEAKLSSKAKVKSGGKGKTTSAARTKAKRSAAKAKTGKKTPAGKAKSTTKGKTKTKGPKRASKPPARTKKKK